MTAEGIMPERNGRIRLKPRIADGGGVDESLRRLSSVSPVPPRRRSRALFSPAPPRWEPAVIIVGIVVALFVLWEVLADVGVIPTFFWSKPSLIWQSAITNARSGTLLQDTAFTFQATLWGFLVGAIGGSLIGLSFWWSKLYWKVSEPLLIVFEAMPKLALAPMIVLAFGIGMTSKVVVAAALVIVIQTLNTSVAVSGVDHDLQTLMYSLGASRMQVFTKIVLPSTLPDILSSFRVAIGLSLTGAIVGEYMGSEHGLGKSIQMAASNFDMSLIWVGVFTLAVLSMVLYLAVVLLEAMVDRIIHH